MIDYFKVNHLLGTINPVKGKLHRNDTVLIENTVYKQGSDIYGRLVSYHQSYYKAKDYLLESLTKKQEELNKELLDTERMMKFAKENY